MIEILREAEGYLELGMIGEAWEATERLEPLDRSEPLAVEIRLRIATAGEKWELGEALANVLICSDIEPIESQAEEESDEIEMKPYNTTKCRKLLIINGPLKRGYRVTVPCAFPC